MKRIAVLLSMALVASAFVLPAAPGKARFAGAAECDVQLPEFPTNGTKFTLASCSGTAYGIDLTNPSAPRPVIAESLELQIESYNESCTLGTPPAIGRADGTISSPAMGHFEWIRVGVSLVFVPVIEGSKVAGIGKFVPTSQPGLCGTPNVLEVTIAGLNYGAL